MRISSPVRRRFCLSTSRSGSQCVTVNRHKKLWAKSSELRPTKPIRTYPERANARTLVAFTRRHLFGATGHGPHAHSYLLLCACLRYPGPDIIPPPNLLDTFIKERKKNLSNYFRKIIPYWRTWRPSFSRNSAIAGKAGRPGQKARKLER